MHLIAFEKSVSVRAVYSCILAAFIIFFVLFLQFSYLVSSIVVAAVTANYLFTQSWLHEGVVKNFVVFVGFLFI